MQLSPSGVESGVFVHHFDLRGELLRPTSFPLCTLPPSVAIAARSSPSTVESDTWFFLFVTRARFLVEGVIPATWQMMGNATANFPMAKGMVRESGDTSTPQQLNSPRGSGYVVYKSEHV